MKQYVRGQIARIIGLYADAAGASQVPTNPTVYVFDPYGVQKISGTPTGASGTGRYYYNLVTATNWEIGRYRVEFYGNGSSGTIRNSAFFELIMGDTDT